MANATVSRLGQKDGAGSDTALFLKVFSGEVLSAFRERNVFMNRHMIRSISSGYTAQFPATWKSSAAYHTPGEEILGTVINGNERTIAIDDLLVASAFLANIDEAMNHYDLRREYSFQLGAALAKTFDQNVAQVAVLAARGSATVSGGNGGSVLTDADGDSNGASLVATLFEAAEDLDDKDVPDMDRTVFVSPNLFYLLVQEDSVIDADLVEGRNGGRDSGHIARVAGFDIVKSNNVPSTNVTTGPSAYRGDFSTTIAVAMHRSAVGTVKLLDLAMESEYDVRRQGTLLVAKYAIGHGILRPESAVEIKTS